MKRCLLALLLLMVVMLPGEEPVSSSLQVEDLLSRGLVRVEAIDQHIVLDLRYASANNFTGKPVYPVNLALLQRDTAVKLAAANAELMEFGYRLKLWDAYRPFYLHQLLWEMAGDKRYFFVDPSYGSVHNRGAAVDVTLVDALGREVEMPTDFDDFSGGAHRHASMSPAARANLDLLTEVMVRNGFQYIDFEWWHFEDISWWQYPILNLPLELFLQAEQ